MKIDVTKINLLILFQFLYDIITTYNSTKLKTMNFKFYFLNLTML